MKHSLNLIAAVVAIPLGAKDGWQNLQFSKIKSNTSVFSERGLRIDVDTSASPLIYPLPKPSRVRAIKATLAIEGTLKTKNFPEDAYLRIGLVAPGSRTMNAAQRVFAADWVKTLFKLAPKGQGIDKIYFFALSDQGRGQSRTHPGSKDLIVETVVAERAPTQTEVAFEHRLSAPQPTVAIWISVDGDDNKAKFTTLIRSLTLETEDD